MLLVLRVVGFLADLVTVVCLAAAGAYLQAHINILALGTSLVLALFRLVEGREFAITFLRCMAEPEHVTLKTVHQALAQGERNLK